MLNGIEGFNASGLMQQLQKNENTKKDASVQTSETVDKKTKIDEQIKNGDYKINTEATSKKMALYLLGKE